MHICYDSNISPTYRRCPVGLRMSNSMRWMWHFALLDTSHPTRPSVLMFSFLLRLKYFSDILWTSGRTPCYRYLKWLGIASFLNNYSCSLFEASHLFNVNLRFFPLKRFLTRSHAYSTSPFRYWRVTHVFHIYTCRLEIM